MLKGVMEQVEAGTYHPPDMSVADPVASQIHLLALLMEVLPVPTQRV